MAPADYGTHLHAVDWALVVASGMFLALRVYCKVWRHRGLWWDDHTLAAAWTSLLIEVILTTIRIKKGFGKHIWHVDPANMPSITLLGRVSSTFSIGAIALSKTSFTLTLLRITTGYVRMALWFVAVSINLTMGSNLVTIWLQCGSKTCDRWSLGYNIFSSAYSALMDLALTLLPWKLLWGLDVLAKEKIGIILAMSMGVFAAFTAIMKCLKLPAMYHKPDDPTYHTSELVLWRTAEAATTIMAASIPILRVLFRDFTSPSNRFYASYRRRMAARHGYPRTNGSGRAGATVVPGGNAPGSGFRSESEILIDMEEVQREGEEYTRPGPALSESAIITGEDGGGDGCDKVHVKQCETVREVDGADDVESGVSEKGAGVT